MFLQPSSFDLDHKVPIALIQTAFNEHPVLRIVTNLKRTRGRGAAGLKVVLPWGQVRVHRWCLAPTRTYGQVRVGVRVCIINGPCASSAFCSN